MKDNYLSFTQNIVKERKQYQEKRMDTNGKPKQALQYKSKEEVT
jgi:hypothetical protein